MDILLATKKGELTADNTITFQLPDGLNQRVSYAYTKIPVNKLLPKVHFTGVTEHDIEFSLYYANDGANDSEDMIVKLVEKLHKWSQTGEPLQFWAGELYKGKDVFIVPDASYEGFRINKNSPQQVKLNIKLIAYQV